MVKRERRLIKVAAQAKEKFVLYGSVITVTKAGDAIRVSRGDTASSYWVRVPKYLEGTLNIGDKCRFSITISTYVSKVNDLVKTSLNLNSFDKLDSEFDLSVGFEEGHIPVNIISSIKTSSENIYLLTVKRMKDGEEMEEYIMRYYSEDGAHPDLGTAIVKFVMYNSKNQFTSKGELFRMLETREYTMDGEDKVAEGLVYEPCLSIKEILR